MTGALMNGAITREMVTAPGIIQEERHDQATLEYFNNFLRGIRRLSVATTPGLATPGRRDTRLPRRARAQQHGRGLSSPQDRRDPQPQRDGAASPTTAEGQSETAEAKESHQAPHQVPHQDGAPPATGPAPDHRAQDAGAGTTSATNASHAAATAAGDAGEGSWQNVPAGTDYHGDGYESDPSSSDNVFDLSRDDTEDAKENLANAIKRT